MRFIPFLLVLSTKNVHKFCPFLMPSKFSHMSSCFMFHVSSSSSQWFCLTVLQPMLFVSYDFNSHLMCHRRMHMKLPLLFFIIFFLNASWLRSARARLLVFSLFSVYSNLRGFNQLQSAQVCLFFVCLLCLFFDSTQFREMLCGFKS